jgi:quercetin dioxygenase-like cupin family protein
MVVTFSVLAEDSNGSVTVNQCDIPDGAKLPVPHSHDAFEETIIGITGTITFTLDGVRTPIGPGESVCIKRGVVHTFAAEDGDTSFYAVATPGVFGPEYFHDIAAVARAAAGGPPDPQAIAAVMLRHGLTPVPPQ